MYLIPKLYVTCSQLRDLRFSWWWRWQFCLFFWVVMLYSLICRFQCFGETYFFHLPGITAYKNNIVIFPVCKHNSTITILKATVYKSSVNIQLLRCCMFDLCYSSPLSSCATNNNMILDDRYLKHLYLKIK